MPPKKRNQSSSKKTTLLFDEATFQAAVSAAVAAVIAQLNANNANVSKSPIGNSDPSNGQQQPTSAYPATQEPQPNPLKRKLKIEEGGTSAQGPSEGQRAEAVNTPVNPSLLTSRRPYLGNLPHCGKCSYHHHGICRELLCARCNMKGHTARVCRTPVERIASITNVTTNPVCRLCGEIGHFKKDYPTEGNNKDTSKEIAPRHSVDFWYVSRSQITNAKY